MRLGRKGRRGAAAAALAVALAACAGARPPAPAAPAAPAAPGYLRISSTPAGARILVDGAPTPYRTPTVLPGLAPGTHRVVLTLGGHRNWSAAVTVPAGACAEASARLEAAAVGGLAVTSIPAGATALVDGAERGPTPIALDDVPIGTSTVMLLRDGYEPWSQAVVVIAGRRLEVEAILTPAAGSLGHLAVQSRPAGAAITLDGFPTGRRTPVTLYGLPAGLHRVDVRLEGHAAWRGTAAVREGRTEDLLVTLAPLPPVLGAARFESDPPGAAIRLDGVLLRARTPADVGDLRPGVFRVELARTGSRTWSGELRVRPGERAALSVVLEPAPP